MRTIFAPDSFKGTVDAATSARALAEGWESVRPHDELIVLPMADGGEGTMEAVRAAVGHSSFVEVDVHGPDGRAVRARWLLLPGEEGLVELASGSGLLLLGEEPEPDRAQSYGFGELLANALDHGVTRLYAAIGGSASSDGGAGMLRALGARFMDADADAGADVAGSSRESSGELGLPTACLSADFQALRPLPERGVEIWSDVSNPLLGDSGAVAVFGAQKGVTSDLGGVVEERLARFADAVERERGHGLRARPGAGAAGGAGFGLLAWGAEMTSGSRAVSELIGLPEAIRCADYVVTGEGRFDAQSADGKVVSEVASLTSRMHAGTVPLAIVAGAIDRSGIRLSGRRFPAFGTPPALLSLEELAGSAERAMAEAEALLRIAGARLAGRVREEGTNG